MSTAPDDRKTVLLEIDYTPYGVSCRDMHITDSNQIVLCRRQAGHEGVHATRQGVSALTWSPQEQGEESK